MNNNFEKVSSEGCWPQAFTVPYGDVGGIEEVGCCCIFKGFRVGAFELWPGCARGAFFPGIGCDGDGVANVLGALSERIRMRGTFPFILLRAINIELLY